MLGKILKWTPATLIILFFLTALIMVNTGYSRLNQVLFFPRDNGNGFNAERRIIRRSLNKEERITQTVKEILLGPSELELENIVPVGTKIQSLIFSEGVLYLDFSPLFFEDLSGFILPFNERLEYVEKNVLFNYPFVKRVAITINGQLPGSPFFRIEQDFNNENS